MVNQSKRCLGITHNFKLCGRHGNWRLFCEDHKYFWIKYLIFFFGLIVGAIELIPNISLIIEKQLRSTNDFYGTWSQHYRYPTSDKNVNVEIAGRVTYFENGNYNFTGRYTIEAKLQSGTTVDINYQTTVTGSWIASSKYLTISLLDKQFNIDGVESQLGVRFDEIAEEYFKSQFPLEEQFIDGLNDQYQVIKITNNSIIVEGRDPNLDPISIELIRLD